MPIISINIPQLGEGLQEARLIEFLKQPGDRVERDECIFSMETDKAISEIEATHSGVIVEWLVDPDTVVEIGAEVGKLEVAEGTPIPAASGHSAPSGHAPAPKAPAAPSPAAATPSKPPRPRGNVLIPPRTRKYLKEKGLLDVADQIPAAGKKLTNEDIDQYLASNSGGSAPAASTNAAYEESPVPSAQQTLIYRIARGTQVVLPATLETEVDWANIAAAREANRDAGGPTAFAMFLHCVVQAINKHPMLRSSMSPDSKTLRTYKHVNLGVAVSLEGDELKTAVVPEAESKSPEDFYSTLAERIAHCRAGNDQIDASTTVTVSNIGIAGMRSGIPLVVTPAVATMALGEIRDQPVPTADGFTFRKVATLTMSFDHRLLNGVGAADFLNTVRELAAGYTA